MKTTALSKEGLTQKFAVVIPAADIERQMEEELASLGHKVKLPGFRPGKVPMNVLKQRYAKDVMGEVVNNTVNKVTRELIEKEKLRPALQPDVKITEFPEGGDMALEIEVEVLPDVQEPDFAKITIEELVCDVADSEVEEGLKRLADNSKHTHKAPTDAEAKLGDVVKIDFVGKLGGEPFEGGAGNGFQLELGSNQFIPGFEEQVVGMKSGMKRTIQVTFPNDYHAKNLAGQKADFDITCHEVLHMHTPEVDEHLAEVVGFESLAKLREAVKSRIEDEYKQFSRAKAKKALFDKLDEMLDFPVPSRMQTLEFDSIWKQIEQAKQQGDETLKDKSEDELKKEYEAIATRRVKLGILLSEVGRKHNVHVTKEELSAAVMQQARQYPGQEDKVFEFYRRNPQQVDELRGPILEEKAVDFILAKVTREQRKVTQEELMAEDDADDKKAKKKKK
jgi:trigger factor